MKKSKRQSNQINKRKNQCKNQQKKIMKKTRLNKNQKSLPKRKEITQKEDWNELNKC